MDSIILTEEILGKGKSKNGAWSAAQLKLFGVLGIKKGWKKKIVGLPFQKQTIQRFLNLKDKHLEKIPSRFSSKSTADSLLFVNQDLPIDTV
jgi:hypothetical protein